MRKNIIDDGFRSDLVETALFDGCFEIPSISKPDKIIIPKGIVPLPKGNVIQTDKILSAFMNTI